eukprot:11564358-Alexandrium_andersonii.AAC.1
MRIRWRLAARAVETLTKKYTASFESWALKHTAVFLRQRWERVLAHLGPRRFQRCRRCNQPKLPACAVSADAGQFFEVCTPSDVDAAMAW